MTLIRRSERVHETVYRLEVTDPTTGIKSSFYCDAEGNPDASEVQEGRDKLLDELLDRGATTQIFSSEVVWTRDGLARCDACGKEVVLHGFTNECECGELYSQDGNHLVDRRLWSGYDVIGLEEVYDL